MSLLLSSVLRRVRLAPLEVLMKKKLKSTLNMSCSCWCPHTAPPGACKGKVSDPAVACVPPRRDKHGGSSLADARGNSHGQLEGGIVDCDGRLRPTHRRHLPKDPPQHRPRRCPEMRRGLLRGREVVIERVAFASMSGGGPEVALNGQVFWPPQ